MNIVSKLAIPFDTNKRAPFKVVFETIRLSELIQIEESKIQRERNKLDNEEEEVKEVEFLFEDH